MQRFVLANVLHALSEFAVCCWGNCIAKDAMEAQSSGGPARPRPQAFLQVDLRGKGRVLGAQVAAAQQSLSAVSSQEYSEGLRRGVAAVSSGLPASLRERLAGAARGQRRSVPPIQRKVHHVACPEDLLECSLGALEDGELEGDSSEKDSLNLESLHGLLLDHKALLESVLAELQKVGSGIWLWGRQCRRWQR
jgi:hypothetical protein